MPILTSTSDLANGDSYSPCRRHGRYEPNEGAPVLSLPLSEPPTRGTQTHSWEMADQELICHLLTGDVVAAGQFVRRFERLIHRQLHEMRVSAQDHEDLFQEVFLHLWEQDRHRLKQWQGRGKGQLSSYLRVVIRRLICDARRVRTLPVAIAMEEVWPEWEESAGDPETSLLSKEQRSAILLALEGLSKRDAELIWRRHYQEESYKEIATGMTMTVNHVGVALARAEQRLRKRLNACYPDLCEAV